MRTLAFFGKETTLRIFLRKNVRNNRTNINVSGNSRQRSQAGREEEIRKVLLKQLTKRFGEIDAPTAESINELSIEQAENLAEAIFDLETREDLNNWLAILQS